MKGSVPDFGFYMYRNMEFVNVFNASNPEYYLKKAEDYFKTHYGIEIQ